MFVSSTDNKGAVLVVLSDQIAIVKDAIDEIEQVHTRIDFCLFITGFNLKACCGLYIVISVCSPFVF